MSLIKYPYTNLHEINLDWIIEEVKKCYSPDNPPTMAVISVNGMTGAVTLYTDPAVNFPEVDDNSWTIGRTAGGAMVGIKFNKTLPLQRMNGTSLFNIYDAGNPPPYPVTSVNGQTGDITIQVAFNSLTGDTISFITPSPAHSWSIDRETLDGAISLKLDTTNDTPSAYLEYVSSDETISRTIKLLTPDDIPSSSGVVSVNGEAGVVTLTGDDIPKEDNSSVSVASAINGLEDDTENLNSKIGNTAMGTTATTVTGAVKEHSTAISNINTKIGNVGSTSLQDQVDTLNSKIGDIQYVYKSGLGHIEGETLIDKFRRAYEANTFPVGNGKPFLGYISAGSQCLVAGFLYMSSNQLYGCGLIGAYNGFKLIRVSAGSFIDASA